MKERRFHIKNKRQSHPMYFQSSCLSCEQILHATFDTDKWVIGFSVFNIKTSKMYQLNISQNEINNIGNYNLDKMNKYQEQKDIIIKLQGQCYDDENEKRKDNKISKRQKFKNKNDDKTKTYKQIRKYFIDLYKLFDYVKKWMKNNKNNNDISIDSNNNTNNETKLQYESSRQQIQKQTTNNCNYYEGNIYDSQMQSGIINTNQCSNGNIKQMERSNEKNLQTKIIQFIEMQKLLRIRFVRIGKKGVKKLDKLKLYLQQMEMYDDHCRLVKELQQVKVNNSRLQVQIQRIRVENSNIIKSLHILAQMRQQIIKKYQQNQQQKQQQQKQQQKQTIVNNQQFQQQKQTLSCQRNNDNDQYQKQQLHDESKGKMYKRELCRKEIRGDGCQQQQIKECADRMRKLNKTEEQQQVSTITPHLQTLFTSLQTTLVSTIQSTIQSKLSSLLPHIPNHPLQYTTINYEHHQHLSHHQLQSQHNQQQLKNTYRQGHCGGKFGTKIYLTFDTNADIFSKQFIVNDQQPFMIKKASAVGCYQVLCNEIIPLKGRWYFEVYLQKISYGIFSIGVFHPRRRNFQYSHDSKDCVVLFGVGMAIMKNSIISGKQVTGHGQFARQSYNPGSNSRHLLKLQDDAIIKVVIDRSDGTIRWYRDEEEIGSTTLPEHLKQEKLIPGFHLNYRDDKVRLNGFYTQE